jgi:hypothetical protein
MVAENRIILIRSKMHPILWAQLSIPAQIPKLDATKNRNNWCSSSQMDAKSHEISVNK